MSFRKRRTTKSQPADLKPKKRSAPTRKRESGGRLKVDPKKVVTGECRSTYMRVLELKAPKDKPDGNKSCGSAIIIPKDDEQTVIKVKRAISSACKEAFGSEFNPWKSRKLKNPFNDGDELLEDPETKMGEEIEDSYVLSCKAYQLPEIRNQHNELLATRDEQELVARSGYWFHFSLYFKAGEYKLEEGGTAKYVTCYLNGIMFKRKDEELGMSRDTTDDFEEYAEEGDDYDYDEDEDFED